MDQELIAYLDARFREASEQVEGLREEFAGFRGETTQQISGLRGEITSLRDEFVGFREETSQNFSRADEKIRQVHIVVEDLRDEIKVLAEGLSGFGEQLNSFRTEVSQSHTELDRRLRPLEMRKRI